MQTHETCGSFMCKEGGLVTRNWTLKIAELFKIREGHTGNIEAPVIRATHGMCADRQQPPGDPQ